MTPPWVRKVRWYLSMPSHSLITMLIDRPMKFLKLFLPIQNLLVFIYSIVCTFHKNLKNKTIIGIRFFIIPWWKSWLWVGGGLSGAGVPSPSRLALWFAFEVEVVLGHDSKPSSLAFSSLTKGRHPGQGPRDPQSRSRKSGKFRDSTLEDYPGD